MNLPTESDEFMKLSEHLRKAQEAAAMLSHLSADNDGPKARLWLQVSEMLKKMNHQVTEIAAGKMKWN